MQPENLQDLVGVLLLALLFRQFIVAALPSKDIARILGAPRGRVLLPWALICVALVVLASADAEVSRLTTPSDLGLARTLAYLLFVPAGAGLLVGEAANVVERLRRRQGTGSTAASG